MARRSMASEIHKCQRLNVGQCCGKGWHLYTYHQPSGIPWSEELRPWYATRREAVEAYREMVAEEARLAAEVR